MNFSKCFRSRYRLSLLGAGLPKTGRLVDELNLMNIQGVAVMSGAKVRNPPVLSRQNPNLGFSDKS